MTDYWMRWVDFARLRDLLVLIIESPEPLRPTTLYRIAIASGVFVSSSGKPFSLSTFYHHHLTLEKLGMVYRLDGRFVSNLRAEEMSPMLDTSREKELTDPQRYVFGDRVVCNDSCYDMLWGIFIRSRRPTTVQNFVDRGNPIVLELRSDGPASASQPRLTLRNRLDQCNDVVHQGHNAVQAIHFGMRRWGVGQLKFLDQLYRVGEGYLIFPVEIRPQVDDESINKALIESLEFSHDWATPRVGDLLFSVASRLRVPLKRVRSVLNEWLKVYASLISPITVSDRMILAGQSKQMRSLILEGFLALPSGEHVSHLQVHRRLLDQSGYPWLRRRVMSHNVEMEALGLKFNPFPPAATGVSVSGEISLPDSWSEELQKKIGSLAAGEGAKALTIIGEYGAGKTYVLQWLMMHVFRPRRILPFFFDNPGVAFYDLANQLLRQVGRYELSKSMWELLYQPEADSSLQGRLIELTFPQWLENLGDRTARKREVDYLAHSLRERTLTDDEEVSFRFAQLIVDTKDRPYFEFRDFIPKLTNSLVPEREEARYFVTVIRILMQIFEASGVAFLIDEFEDVALGRRLAKRQVSEYTATLRRLLDIARDEEFWLALSITPEGLVQTSRLEPALLQRFSARFTIPRLSDCDAFNLVLRRLNEARHEGARKDLWPFENDVLMAMEERNRSTPRRLIRILWQSMAIASQKGIKPPFSKSLITEAEQLLSEET